MRTVPGVFRAWAVMRSALVTPAPRSRKAIAFLLVAIPLILQAVTLIWGRERVVGAVAFAWMLENVFLSLIVPLILMVFGISAVGEEWEMGTAPYLLTVPVPRSALVIGRWTACLLRALTFIAPTILLSYLLILHSHIFSLPHHQLKHH